MKMHTYNKIFLVFILPLLLITSLSYGQITEKENEPPKINQFLVIETFSAIPPEIDGCSCTFSNDSIEYKKGKYIYANDLGSISFLKINGNLTKFDMTEFKEVNSSTTIVKAKNDLYEIIVTVLEGKQTGEETSSKTGTIKLIDKKGRTITKTFYGECGC
jgi:hypothetical protein